MDQQISQQPFISPHSNFVEISGHLVDAAQFTKWENPNDTDVILDLHEETPKHGGKSIRERVPMGLAPEQYREDLPGSKAWEEKTGKKRIVIRAHTIALIQSKYDSGIHDVRNGVIVGGLAPTLRRVGVENHPVLAPALDNALAREKEQRQQAEAALRRAIAAEQQLAQAQAELLKFSKAPQEPMSGAKPDQSSKNSDPKKAEK
jgi:hypothetical protein